MRWNFDHAQGKWTYYRAAGKGQWSWGGAGPDIECQEQPLKYLGAVVPDPVGWHAVASPVRAGRVAGRKRVAIPDTGVSDTSVERQTLKRMFRTSPSWTT